MKFGYARVSTDDQHLDLQRNFLVSEGCGKIYEEKISGKTNKRAELKAAISELKAGDVLVVWKLDRLGRSLLHILLVAYRLERRGIELQCLYTKVDLKSAIGRFQFHMLCAVAELEVGQTSERTIAGVQAARRNGKTLGRPRRLSDKQIERARSLIKDGATFDIIAAKLKVSRTTLWRAVSSECNPSP